MGVVLGERLPALAAHASGGNMRAILFGRLLAFALLLVVGIPGLPRAETPAAPPSWPHTTAVDGANVVVYEPQAIAWPEHQTLTARAAVAITPAGEATPILGTIDVSLATETDLAIGEVTLSDPKLTRSHFPSLDTEKAAKLEDRIRAALPNMQTKEVPLKTILLSLKEQPQLRETAVNNEPPVIFHSERLASLVVFDGEPVLAPIGKTGLQFTVNTNWDVLTDGSTWYLLNNGHWLAAPVYSGPYQPLNRLPAAFSAIPANKNFAEIRQHVPAQPQEAASVPTIYVSTKPAEIIVTAGPPQFAKVAGTSLLAVKNTASVLFLDSANHQFYYLVSGRWFSAPGLDGPWQFAANDLPPDFALIPPNGPYGHVLASVPNTAPAQEAVLRAGIPEQATLKRDAAKLNVTYAGKPQFKPIPGTSIAYAANTHFEVLEVSGAYYACYQGAWFVAPTPTGPWVLATSIPQVIYTIPPSSPVYNVTYVTVRASTPATVTYAYTAGYMLGYITAGVVVYGTGYYYPPVVVPGAVPAYFPYPYSYAGNVWYNATTGAWARGGTVYGPYGGAATGGTYYNPTTGAWARGGAVYGPYGGAGAWSAYNPSTGSYARGSASWGAYGGTANASFYNARTGVSGTTTQNANAYERWGSSVLTGPNATVHTESASNAKGTVGAFSSSTGAEGLGYHGVNGNNGAVGRGANGDVYAGHDGNAYRHTSDGWSKWSDGSWQPVQPPQNTSTHTSQNATQSGRGQRMDSTNYQQLEQDRGARWSGRQNNSGTWRGRRANGASGSERFSSGGGFEGGQRFRR
jgi:hypothetical protein